MNATPFAPLSPPVLKTRGELEAEVLQCVIRCLKEMLGRGPQNARAFLCESLIVIRCSIPLQPQEKTVLAADRTAGTKIIREWRQTLIQTCQVKLSQEVSAIIGVAVKALLCDSSPEHEETVITFTLANQPLYRMSSWNDEITEKSKKLPE